MTIQFAWGCYYQANAHENTKLVDTNLLVLSELGIYDTDHCHMDQHVILQFEHKNRIYSVRFDHSIEPNFIPDGIIVIIDNKALVPDGYWFVDNANLVWKMIRVGFNEWTLVAQTNETIASYIKQVVDEAL